MAEITLDATVENIDRVTDFVDEILEDNLCPMRTVMQVNVAIDELFSNIAHYAYGSSVGQATVIADVSDGPRALSVTFIDGGVPYDPLAKADPDITLSAEERSIGGLGIFMVKKTMTDLKYEYKDGKNVLTMIKEF
ncbi:MAG: ATP-binding protein [Clostridia bacterium]|nr:ATP-binding protein [Clostridia bacterium]